MIKAIAKNRAETSPEFGITAVLAEAPSPTEAMPKLLKVLCEGFGWDLGEAWLVLLDTKLVQLRTIWHVPNLEHAPEWEELYRGISAQRGRGLVGRAWDQCKVQWSSDLRSDAAFVRISLASRLGLISGCAVPLCVDERVLGVVSLFSRSPRPFDAETAERLKGLGHQIARLVQTYVGADRSDRFLGELLDSAPDILAALRLDGTIEYENAAAEKVLGYRLEERIGRNVFDFIHPDDIPVALDAFQKGLAEVGSVQRLEVRVRRRDGSWVWLESLGSVKSDKSGMVAVVVSRDISERKRQGGGRQDEAAASPTANGHTVDLTNGELRVVRLLSRGLSNREIAGALSLSPHTVKEYVAKISRKLGARNRSQVAAMATQRRIV